MDVEMQTEKPSMPSIKAPQQMLRFVKETNVPKIMDAKIRYEKMRKEMPFTTFGLIEA